ncbi:MAG: YlmC/YmxH family sporulation protein [Bacillota bacterium]
MVMYLRLSEMRGKEIVNVGDATRLGRVGDSDLTIDPQTGEIAEILVPLDKGLLNIGHRRQIGIPWKAVVRIGPDLMIVKVE